ncbi:ATP-dependent nuclease [Pseudomonas sp. IT-P260]|uniref:ATP-dependent nuclease n=1 Tax=Pseudomonas sp. IT-P260 TaxID=3026457 RepID=UPI0039E0CADD
MQVQKIWSNNLVGYSSISPDEKWIKLRKLNLLIGPNNSGKSRLLRALFSTKPDKLIVSIDNAVKHACRGLEKLVNVINDCDQILDFDCNEFNGIYEGDCKEVNAVAGNLQQLIRTMNYAKNQNFRAQGSTVNEFNLMRRHLPGENLEEALNRLERLSSEVLNIKKHYIPILRGMRPLGDGKDLFLERTLRDYFPTPDELNVVTGFDLYNLLARFLLGQPDERERVRSYEKILGNEFFGGAEVTLIPQYGQDTVAVKIGNDAQFSIYDLGDGLQQVIIITSAAFLEQENSIFFIEEPEACLHPGLLRKLALFLLNHTNHQYVATTHSNHLLDLAESHSEVIIHRVSKKNNQDGNGFFIQECTKDREILADLGVRASSVYLANSTIWVEGITDRLYLKVIMRKYLNSLEESPKKTLFEGYLENYHYAFVEYQGGTLGHWGFDDDDDTTERLNASRLCADAFLLADGDIVGKSERAQTLSAELQDRFYLLPGKEIENLLPPVVVLESAKKIFSRKLAKTKEGLDSDKLEAILGVDLASSTHGIGYHLDKTLGLKGKGKERRVFADESGTINDKVKFCQQAVQVMNDIEWDLSNNLVELCKKIYNHIELRN